MRVAACLIAVIAAAAWLCADPANLCPNPGIELGEGDAPEAWVGSPGATWDAEEHHSGTRCLKLNATEPAKPGWTSAPIPVTPNGRQLALSVWARLQGVTGRNGAYIVLFHLDADGKRIGQSAGLSLGGAGSSVATKPWEQYFVVSQLTPEVKAVNVHLRLYDAVGTLWVDDVGLYEYSPGELPDPRPLCGGVRLEAGTLAIVAPAAHRDAAERIHRALAQKGHAVPVIGDDTDPRTEQRDLIVLGNLATSHACETLYLNYYTYEDLYYPGEGGYVIRPLTDPFGTGSNILALGASDDAGLATATELVVEAITEAGAVLDMPLQISTGGNWGGMRSYPWPGAGPYREMQPAGEYLKTGDIRKAHEYREKLLAEWFTHTDESLADRSNVLHLIYHSMTMSWDLMEASGVFSDEERLRLTNQLLKVMRSNQAFGYAGLTGDLRIRGNHDIRNARSFYFGYRYFRKYYADDLGPELAQWERKLRDFFGVCFSSARSHDESLSQHAFGGSLNCLLDVGLMEPEWADDFFASGRAQRMGDRCIAICNNMGQTVMLGDTNPTDYPSVLFAKLGYYYRDGRYWFMIDKRGRTKTTGDEAMRGFATGVEPTLPEDHIGLRVIPADELYMTTALRTTNGVTAATGFDKLSFREGFHPDDEYLMIDGVSAGGHAYEDANSIGEFSAHGRRWLCEIDIFNGPTMGFHNAVTVARDGLGSPDLPQAAELVARASGDGYAYAATRLPGYNDMDWTRHTLWIPGAQTFVLDELVARAAGDYSCVLGWRSLGAPSLEPGRFRSAQDDTSGAAATLDGKSLAAAVKGHSGEVIYHSGDTNALFCVADSEGDFVEVGCVVPRAGEYAVALTPWRHQFRGIVAVTIDGQAVGEPVDMYGDGAKDDPLEVGVTTLSAGDHAFRLSVVGKNPAAEGYAFGIRRLSFWPAGATARSAPRPNRFVLAYPADVAASFDRDTAALAQYLPQSEYHDQALNILEQSANWRLQPGETRCFQNAFAAVAGDDQRDLRLRRINDHCCLLNDGREVWLLGAGVDSVEVETAGVLARGKAFCIGARRVILCEATASFLGVELRTGESAPDGRLADALKSAWEQFSVPLAQQRPPWANAPASETRVLASLPGVPLCAATRHTPDGLRLDIGCEDGTVLELDAAGTVTARHQTGGPVHTLCAVDLDGNGSMELLAGSDDEHLYAFGTGLSVLFSRRIPFLPDEQPWMYWTLRSAKIRKVHADDINGDGKPELLLGVGNMRLHCLDAGGEELWRFRTDHGTCDTITTADLYGDGRRLVIAANGLTSSSGTVWVFDGVGTLLQSYRHAPWGSSTPALAVADLTGNGTNMLICGNTQGNVQAYPPLDGERAPQELWLHNLTRPIRALLPLAAEGRAGFVAVGADSGYLSAFGADGQSCWGVPLSGAVVRLVSTQGADGTPGLAAGCADGTVFCLNAEGAVRGVARCGGRLRDLLTADTDGDGRAELIAVTADPAAASIIECE